MAIEKRNHLYEVLIRGNHDGITGVHQKHCECLIDSETGETLKETITPAAGVDLEFVGDLLNDFCKDHVEQVARQLQDINDLKKVLTVSRNDNETLTIEKQQLTAEVAALKEQKASEAKAATEKMVELRTKHKAEIEKANEEIKALKESGVVGAIKRAVT